MKALKHKFNGRATVMNVTGESDAHRFDELKRALNAERNELAECEAALKELTQRRRQLQNTVRETRKQLGAICQHTWTSNPPVYQSPTTWTCHACGNTK